MRKQYFLFSLYFLLAILKEMVYTSVVPADRLAINHTHTCRCDGIGRRSGLKIHRWRHRAGSSPATGTKKADTPTGVSAFFIAGRTRTGGSISDTPRAQAIGEVRLVGGTYACEA